MSRPFILTMFVNNNASVQKCALSIIHEAFSPFQLSSKSTLE